MSLYTAARMGDLEQVRSLLASGIKPDAERDEINTPLMAAVLNGHTDVLIALINAKANIHEKNHRNWTPLMRAALKGYTDVAIALVKAKADINAKNNRDSTVLMVAARNGHNDVAIALVKAKANIHTKDWCNDTPLTAAALKGNTNIVITLLAAKADINAKNNYRKDVIGIMKGNLKRHRYSVSLLEQLRKDLIRLEKLNNLISKKHLVTEHRTDAIAVAKKNLETYLDNVSVLEQYEEDAAGFAKKNLGKYLDTVSVLEQCGTHAMIAAEDNKHREEYREISAVLEQYRKHARVAAKENLGKYLDTVAVLEQARDNFEEFLWVHQEMENNICRREYGRAFALASRVTKPPNCDNITMSDVQQRLSPAYRDLIKFFSRNPGLVKWTGTALLLYFNASCESKDDHLSFVAGSDVNCGNSNHGDTVDGGDDRDETKRRCTVM